jgi:hypothetical protein
MLMSCDRTGAFTEINLAPLESLLIESNTVLHTAYVDSTTGCGFYHCYRLQKYTSSMTFVIIASFKISACKEVYFECTKVGYDQSYEMKHKLLSGV